MARMVERKRLLGGLAGLVLVAGALFVLLRPDAPAPDPSDRSAIAEPAGQPGPAAPQADSNAAAKSAVSSLGPDAPASASGPPDSEMPAIPPPVESAAGEPVGYDARVSAMVGAIQAGRAAGPEAIRHASILLGSQNPMDQVGGLALMAGLGRPATPEDLRRYSPEVVLAAVDLCGSLFDDAPARALLGQWIEAMGGAQAAGEMAHTLLLESRLPYGGGSTALDMMMRINDPQAILVGLEEFAVQAGLPPAYDPKPSSCCATAWSPMPIGISWPSAPSGLGKTRMPGPSAPGGFWNGWKACRRLRPGPGWRTAISSRRLSLGPIPGWSRILSCSSGTKPVPEG